MRRIRTVLLASLLLGTLFGTNLSPASVAAANTYYVATNGANTNPGSQAKPFQTIAYALTRLRPGDTLYVRGGTYAERVANPKTTNGSASAPIKVLASPGERPVIQGLLWLKNISYWTFSGVNVTWASGNSSQEHMVKFSGSTGWTFTSAEVWGARSYSAILVTGGATNFALTNLVVHDTYKSNGANQDHLIYVSNGSNGLIERNLLYNSPNGRAVKIGASSSAGASPTGIQVRYNTMVNNTGKSNISLSFGTSGNTVQRNIMVISNEESVVAFDLSGSNNVVKDNVWWQASGVVEPNSKIVDGGGNLNVNPSFGNGYVPGNPAAKGYGHTGNGATSEASPAPSPSPTPSPPPNPTPSPTASPTPTSTPSPTTSPTPSPTPSSDPTVNDSFNDGTTNGWSGSASVADTPSASDKSLVTTSRVSRTVSQVTNGRLTLQAEFMIDRLPSSVATVNVQQGGNALASLQVTSTGNMRVYNGTSVATTLSRVLPGQWYGVVIVVDLDRRLWSYEVRGAGGKLLSSQSNLAFPSAQAKAVDRLSFSISDRQGARLYIDDVTIRR